MKSVVSIDLTLSAEQMIKLRQLNDEFVRACNELFPIVIATGCWNRVGLHHLGYRLLRDKFPSLGSQMACNAIYSVSRTCRQVFQNPKSQFYLDKKTSVVLPQIRFVGECPVFFDKHTVSLKGGLISLYTLDGRIRFKVDLDAHNQKRFLSETIKEIVLLSKQGGYCLSFDFGGAGFDADTPEMPEYVFVVADSEKQLMNEVLENGRN